MCICQVHDYHIFLVCVSSVRGIKTGYEKKKGGSTFEGIYKYVCMCMCVFDKCMSICVCVWNKATCTLHVHGLISGFNEDATTLKLVLLYVLNFRYRNTFKVDIQRYLT